MNRDRQWTCRVGYMSEMTLPERADRPLRKAVMETYEKQLGKEPDFCESGWGEPRADLGLATTEQLLDEILSRLEVGRPQDGSLHRLVEFLARQLTDDELTYRTVDS